MRVLLADESHTMRSIVRRALESLGVKGTCEASDGPQAIEMIKASRRFDLIVTDWNMPVKTGGELIHEIRALDPEVPIVMITSEADKWRVLEAINAGVSDYIIKPFSTDLLRTKLEAITGHLAPAGRRGAAASS
jgi:two-component system chemotaxis response regulator CheY